MAVAHDAAAESHTGTTGSTSQASFSWTHTPVGTPKGVLVFVFQANNSGDDTTSVTYGTGGSQVTLSAVSGANAVDSAGEPGRCKAYFVGSSIPTGAQTVTVNRTNNTNVMYAVSITVTAGMDTVAVGPVLLQGDGTYTEQAVDDGSPGVDSMRYAGGFTGGSNVLAAGANSTVTGMPSIDFGLYCISTCRESAAGQGSRNVGFSFGTSDDRAAVHLAIREKQMQGAASVSMAFTVSATGYLLVRLLADFLAIRNHFSRAFPNSHPVRTRRS